MATTKLEAYAAKRGLTLSNLRLLLGKGPCGQLPEDLRTDDTFDLLLTRAEGLGLDPLSGDLRVTSFDGYSVSLYLSTDGFLRIANEHPQFDGLSVETPPEDEWLELPIKVLDRKVRCPAWVSVTIQRKDRTIPTVVREYLDECYSLGQFDEASGCFANGPWQRSPKRQLANRAISSAVRIAFGVIGLTDALHMGAPASETIPVKETSMTTTPSSETLMQQPKMGAQKEDDAPVVVTEDSVDELIRESETLTKQHHVEDLEEAFKPLQSTHVEESAQRVESLEEASVMPSAEEKFQPSNKVDYDHILKTTWQFFKEGQISGDEVRQLCEQHKEALPAEKRSALLARVLAAEIG